MRRFSRWKAAAWHAAISAAIVSAAFALVLELWYPRPLLEATGGERLLRIMVGIDVVIGPLVTLMVFDAKKSLRALRFDLVVIAVLQLAALGYGVLALFTARPVFIVFAVDRLEVVRAVDIPEEELSRTHGEYTSLPLTGPALVAAQLPADADERNRILFSAVKGGPDLAALPQYYRSYAGAAALAHAQPLSALMARHPESRPELERHAPPPGLLLEEVRYLPVRARSRSFSALIDPANGAVLGYAMVDPWTEK